MVGAEAQWESLFAGLEKLRTAWPSAEWGYDRRFKCVMSTITIDQQAEARAASAGILPLSFGADTLAGAPPGARALAEQYGGVRSGQLLFWGGESGAPGAFGLWWPWGDGKSISLRIGLHDVDTPKVRYPQLRELFGIPQAPTA
jgi:hypothetical protein